MGTIRSLNKLEFKAHMSIHNSTEVKEEEAHEAQQFTRDRFGKKHALSSEDGSVRIKGLKKKLAVVLLLGGLASPVLADSGEPVKHSNTNIQVNSEDLSSASLKHKLNSTGNPREEGGAVFYKDDSHSFGINEDGDPALTTNF